MRRFYGEAGLTESIHFTTGLASTDHATVNATLLATSYRSTESVVH
jgi:hypothetical protein